MSEAGRVRCFLLTFKPLQPNIRIHVLHTALYAFLKMHKENLFNNQ